jgi:hypothetical protein
VTADEQPAPEPPVIETKARFVRDIKPGPWRKAKFSRPTDANQVED